MKKLLALLLAALMVISLFAACGNNGAADDTTGAADNTTAAADDTTAAADGTITNPDDIADEMTSEDGKYEVAFITDVGQLKDKSFNQGTYDGVKLYAANNGLTYKYYQPANGDQATDDDRIDAMKAACDNGAKIVVAAGFMQEAALRAAATAYPDVKFIFIDGYPVVEDTAVEDSPVLTNIAGISFQEEQSGYLAGYAAVKEGYTKLGFTGGGGGTNPACCRFGYGFVQGADAAAKEMDANIEINYSWLYGASFAPSNDLQTMATGWYQTGTEVIFCCGGGMFQSVVAAAGAEDGLVIGVDVDQSPESETVITSATKGLSDATQWALAKFYAGEFDDIGGTSTALGAKDNAVGLPTATWSLENWTVADYEALLAQIVDGTVTIDADWNNMTSTDNTKVTIVE